MDKTIYIVRHCEAEGQSPHADLTAEGVLQANELAAFFEDKDIDRIITSPYLRARMTAAPIAEKAGFHYEEDSRLAERTLSSHEFKDWLLKLEDTFLDMNLKYEGGESSNEASARVCDVVDELPDGSRVVLVTHGNLMTLLLRCFDERIGFQEWQALTNPDVYEVVQTDGESRIQRVWGNDAADAGA